MTSQQDLDIQQWSARGKTPWQIAVLCHLPVMQVRLALHRMQLAPVIEARPAKPRVIQKPVGSTCAPTHRVTLDMAEVLHEVQPFLKTYMRGDLP